MEFFEFILGLLDLLDFIINVLLPIGEFLVVVSAELFVDITMHLCARQTRKPKPIYAGTGYCLLGIILGILSLFVFPEQLIKSNVLLIANLLCTPLLVGTVMMITGRYRAKRGKYIIGLETFAYGFLFAFSMSLVRYVWAV